MATGDRIATEKTVARSRPRLADTLVDLDFENMPKLDIYGSVFEERAQTLDKINVEVAKSLYDWKPSAGNNGNCREPTEGSSNEQQAPDTCIVLDDVVVVEEPAPPPRPLRHARQSKKTKKMLSQIERMKAEALANVLPEPEPLMDFDVLDDEVMTKMEQDYEYNRTITVRITDYCGNIKKYTMLKRDSFIKVIDDLAQEHKIEPEQVMLTFKDVFIKVYDTPASIGLGIGDLIDFCKLSKPLDAPLTEMDKANRVTLKVQSATSRKRLEITINKVDPLSKLMKEYCKMSGQDLAKLSFKFDDEDIAPDDTPNDLELEDGYCIDVIENK